MLKNALVYVAESGSLDFDMDKLNSALAAAKCDDPHPTASQSDGFTELYDDFVLDIGDGLFALMYKRNERLLPPKVISLEVSKRVKAIEVKDGRKVFRKEKTNIRDEVIFDLLPKAFVIPTHNLVIIDTKTNTLIISSNSNNRAEEILNVLRETLGTLSITPISLSVSAVDVLNNWAVPENKKPEGVVLTDRCELYTDAGDAQAKFINVAIEDESVNQHILDGWRVSRASIIFEDHVEFDLTDSFAFKRIKMLAALELLAADQAERYGSEDKGDQADFIANIYLLCETLFRRFLGLINDHGK